MTELLRIAIVDDEAPAREVLRLRLRQEADVMIVGEFGDVARAVESMRADVPDVVLLDVEMPGLNGFSLLEQLGDARPIVIFVTAHERHALRAFGVPALDYLLKPVEQVRLREALDRARRHLEISRKSALADRMRQLVDDLDSTAVLRHAGVGAGGSERIAVRDDGVIRFVELRDVDWIEAAGDTVRLHVGDAVHVVRRPLGELLSTLPPDRFLQIHRSTIVNIERVRELEPWFHGEYIVTLMDDTKLKLSRTHRDALARLTR